MWQSNSSEAIKELVGASFTLTGQLMGAGIPIPLDMARSLSEWACGWQRLESCDTGSIPGREDTLDKFVSFLLCNGIKYLTNSQRFYT